MNTRLATVVALFALLNGVAHAQSSEKFRGQYICRDFPNDPPSIHDHMAVLFIGRPENDTSIWWLSESRGDDDLLRVSGIATVSDSIMTLYLQPHTDAPRFRIRPDNLSSFVYDRVWLKGRDLRSAGLWEVPTRPVFFKKLRDR